MYDLTVAVAHTYYVGEGEWLVHNCTPTDRLKEHLTDRDLAGARGDLAGDPVLGAGGRPFQHLKEVQDAQRGLLNRIEQLKQQLSYVGLHPGRRAQLMEELGEASRLLDYAEQWVKR